MAAETAVSFVLNTVSNLLREEVSLLVGVKDEVEWLRVQLRWMKSFLKDAYTKRRRGDERAKQWERDVREAAYQVEDIIESYMIEIISRRQQPLRWCGILKPVKRYARELKSRHKLGADIKQLKVKIQQISENRTAFGLVGLGQSAPDSTTDPDLQERRRISPRYGDSVVVGFQEHKRKILGEMLDTNITRRCVKSIVGMGGLGKTTLAKMVFNADEITKSFRTRAWVSVSQDYKLIQLLKGLTKEITGSEDLTKQITGSESDEVDESALRERIYEFLQGKRFNEFPVILCPGMAMTVLQRRPPATVTPTTYSSVSYRRTGGCRCGNGRASSRSTSSESSTRRMRSCCPGRKEMTSMPLVRWNTRICKGCDACQVLDKITDYMGCSSLSQDKDNGWASITSWSSCMEFIHIIFRQ